MMNKSNKYEKKMKSMLKKVSHIYTFLLYEHSYFLTFKLYKHSDVQTY
jgi:hypothetical protein